MHSICNKEVVRAMIDDLDASCTRKVTKKLEAKQKKADLAVRRNDVNAAEAYSPSGMTEAACKLGYTRGFVLDLTNKRNDGTAFDLSIEKTQDEAIALFEETAPWLVVVSPPYTMASTIQQLKFNANGGDITKTKLQNAVLHVGFTVLLCLKQAKAGRKFVFKHPAGTNPWTTTLTNKLYFIQN